MLFALHLNAASVSSASASVQDATQIAGLSAYRLGDVDVRFCESATSDLLLVLFAPMTLGAPAATFLAAEILRSFEHRFGEQLRQQQAQPHGSATPGGSARVYQEERVHGRAARCRRRAPRVDLGPYAGSDSAAHATFRRRNRRRRRHHLQRSHRVSASHALRACH